MKVLALLILPLAALAQLPYPTIPNSDGAQFRSHVNSNFSWLYTNKAGVSACPSNQYAIQTATAGVVCASLTSLQITTALGYTPDGGPEDFTGVRTVGGCPMFPAAAVFNKDISGLDADPHATAAYIGGRWQIGSISWAAGTATVTLDSGWTTDGLITGSMIFISAVTPTTYNTVVSCTVGSSTFTSTTGFGSNRCNVDIRKTITVIDSTHFSYPITSDPGAYVSGGQVSKGNYGGGRLGTAPDFYLNFVTNATPGLHGRYDGGAAGVGATQASVISSSRMWNIGSLSDSENLQWQIQNSHCMEGYIGDGTCPTVATGPWACGASPCDPKNPGTISRDAHWQALNTDTCSLQEIYALEGSVPPLRASNGARWNTRSLQMRSGEFFSDDSTGYSSADAAGMPRWNFVVTRDQVYGSESITGVQGITFPVTAAAGWVWPAAHFSSNNFQFTSPPMGAVFRMKASYDCSALPDGTGGTPNVQKLCAAWKKYGVINVDNGTSGLMLLEGTFTTQENADLVTELHKIYFGDAFEIANVPRLQRSKDSFEALPFTPVAQVPLIYTAVGSSPAGLSLTVDGATCTSPCEFVWEAGSTHTVAAVTQTSGGAQYVFSSWTDSGAASHTVSPSANATYVATFTAQYLLTTSVTPAGGGTITAGGYFSAGASIPITVTPTAGYQFLTFTGGLTGGTNPQTLIMPAAATTVSGALVADATWYDVNWQWRKPVVITAASGGSNLTDFPVTIAKTDTDLQAAAQADGDDILFTSVDGTTKLAHEIERYTTGSGELIAHVKIPTYSASEPTVLWMYYGYAGASNQQSVTSTWNSNYKAVYHVKDGTTLSVADVTSNANNCTNTGTATATTGQIDGAISLNGSSQYMSACGSTGLDFGHSDSFTISAWIFPTGVTGRRGIWARSQDATHVTIFETNTTMVRFAVLEGAISNIPTAAVTLSTSTWYHVAMVRTAGTNWQMYVNGVASGSAVADTTTGDFYTSYSAPTIGREGFSSPDYFAGKIDEVRITRAALSAGWIATTYANQFAPNTFVLFFTQEAP